MERRFIRGFIAGVSVILVTEAVIFGSDIPVYVRKPLATPRPLPIIDKTQDKGQSNASEQSILVYVNTMRKRRPDCFIQDIEAEVETINSMTDAALYRRVDKGDPNFSKQSTIYEQYLHIRKQLYELFIKQSSPYDIKTSVAQLYEWLNNRYLALASNQEYNEYQSQAALDLAECSATRAYLIRAQMIRDKIFNNLIK